MKITNYNFRKRFLSMLTAGVLATTPVIAHASSYVDEEEEEISMEAMDAKFNKDFQDAASLTDDEIIDLSFLETQDVDSSMTLTDYAKMVKDGYEYLQGFRNLNCDNLKQELQCLSYLVNIEHIDEALREELASRGFIASTFEDNFAKAYNLINCINVNNQKEIRNGYEEGKIDDTKLINVSRLCFSNRGKRLVDSIHNNYVKAYENGRFPNEYSSLVFNQLTNVSNPGAGNVYQISIGERWLAQVSIGTNIIRMYKDDLQDDFSNYELYQYFVQEDLNRAQWNVRSDIALDLNCLKNELEEEVFKFGQARELFVKKVNNDLVGYAEENCKTR